MWVNLMYACGLSLGAYIYICFIPSTCDRSEGFVLSCQHRVFESPTQHDHDCFKHTPPTQSEP